MKGMSAEAGLYAFMRLCFHAFMDPFALLGLPRSFDIDARALQATYLKRSASLHPDRSTNPLEQAEVRKDEAARHAVRAARASLECLARLGGG